MWLTERISSTIAQSHLKWSKGKGNTSGFFLSVAAASAGGTKKGKKKTLYDARPA